VLRRISGIARGEVRDGWIKLQIEGLHNFVSSPYELMVV
jgi:hypothetical protein